MLKARFQPGQAPHIIIVTRPPTVPGRELNPGPLSLEDNALLNVLARNQLYSIEQGYHCVIFVQQVMTLTGACCGLHNIYLISVLEWQWHMMWEYRFVQYHAQDFRTLKLLF